MPREQLTMPSTTAVIRVRDVRSADAAALAHILNAIFKEGTFTVLDKRLTTDDQRRFIEEFPSRGVFHVAELISSGEVVGMQNVEPFANYTGAFDHVGIIATYVDTPHRHSGVGVRMAETTFAAAREKGFEKLFSYVRADNSDALGFYRKIGFRVVGTAERQARIGDSYVDEVVIERQL